MDLTPTNSDQKYYFYLVFYGINEKFHAYGPIVMDRMDEMCSVISLLGRLTWRFGGVRDTYYEFSEHFVRVILEMTGEIIFQSSISQIKTEGFRSLSAWTRTNSIKLQVSLLFALCEE
jgi:hypothetical protein